MNIRRSALAGILASALTLGGGIATAQDATPQATPAASPVAGAHTVTLGTPGGKIAGFVEITEGDDGVTFRFESTVDSSLEPGSHGIHIHEVGACDASGGTPYASAGGHYNPSDTTHGGPDDEDSHAGDLGNLDVANDGTYSYEIATDKVSLDPDAEATLADEDGSAIVIHAGEDDLETDPSGDSGDRVACGIVFPSAEPAMNIVPPEAATPAASPAS